MHTAYAAAGFCPCLPAVSQAEDVLHVPQTPTNAEPMVEAVTAGSAPAEEPAAPEPAAAPEHAAVADDVTNVAEPAGDAAHTVEEATAEAAVVAPVAEEPVSQTLTDCCDVLSRAGGHAANHMLPAGGRASGG